MTNIIKPKTGNRKPTTSDIIDREIAYSRDEKTMFINDNGEIVPIFNQVNADWNATSGDAQILNKPTIPAAQIQSDWNQTNNTQVDYIKNKPSIPTKTSDLTNDSGFLVEVAFTDLTDAPSDYTGQGGKAVYVNGDEDGLIFQDAVSSDEKVKITATDTTTAYLSDKLSSNGNVAFTIENSGGNETLRADVDLSGYYTTSEVQTNYVPYSGATNDIDIGNHRYKAGTVETKYGDLRKGQFLVIDNEDTKTFAGFLDGTLEVGAYDDGYGNYGYITYQDPDMNIKNLNGKIIMVSNGDMEFWSLGNYKLPTLINNGFVKTSNSDGTLIVDTNTYLTDAVSDGKIYGRKNATWTEVSITQTKTINFSIGDGNNAIILGTKGYIRMPVSGTITAWYLTETSATPIAGSCVIDIWKDTTANYPPTVSDSIAGTEKPTLSSQNINSNNTLASWTKSVNVGDYIGFNIDSNSGCKKLNLQITIII